ncbi:Multidrug efflux system ATP-binding protein [Periweissella fabaria]|uniref:Multidrug efflux system ATP-binding protein n=2 Tax=Periweissella fabaria TaxID=546157 RepID=A0ABM8Z7C2_9LACO|nr:Multidrug efflux system ATP-binding protein [Periweissella fabaria]
MVPIIELKDITKKFGKFTALKNISFQINSGEVLGFIGPNGAGKSTTIRILLGILRADSGTVKILEQDAWQNSVAVHRQVAYVPGDVYLWPNLTGGEAIDLLLKMNGGQHTERTEELITKFGLDVRKKARTYSKGNRQKVALVAALSMDVALYIFDEPTSGLDPLNEATFQKEVLTLKEQGKSVLLSSHILSEVEKICDQIVIIRNGEIVESGSLSQMRHLTRTNLRVKTSQPITDIQLQVKVMNLMQQADGTVTMTIDQQELSAVMAYLAQKGIISLVSTQPSLDELFMEYYQDANDARKY